jgi:murein DD-endopeptidase MepM/ murein hydrolase activator NlpD
MDFRQYDSAIGKFYGMDALAEYSFDKTPYRFGFNNPNIWSDPTGLFETEDEAKKHIDKYGLSKAKISFNDSRGVYEIENIGYSFWQQGNDMGMTYTDSEGSPTINILKGGASKDLSGEDFNKSKIQSIFFPVDFNSKSYLNVNAAKFGSNRGNRKHAGIDIYAPVGTKVNSISDGVVIRDPYHFYRGSYALEINHGTYTIRYTEINPLNLKMGDSVKAGQDIGTIMKMQGINNTMLHLEKYSNTKKGSLTNRNNPPYQRRGDLVNPTNFIDSLRVNQF